MCSNPFAVHFPLDLYLILYICLSLYAPFNIWNAWQVWDLRQIKQPLKVFEDLPNHYAQTNIAFSPDEHLFLTGTSVERESTTGGLLCFYDRARLELVSRVGISPTCSVVQSAWHPKLNQVKKRSHNMLLFSEIILKSLYMQ